MSFGIFFLNSVFFSGAVRNEHAGHGLEPQEERYPFSRKGGGKEKSWASCGDHACYLPSCRDNSHLEDKNLE